MDVEAELAQVAHDWAQAIVADDAARIAEFVTDDWVMVSSGGVDRGDRFLALVASGALSHSAMELLGGLRVRVYGETALVTGRVTNTAHHAGQEHVADEWTTDVFVRTGGRWRCVLTQTTDAAVS